MRVLHVGKFFAPFSGGIENAMLDLLRAGAGLGIDQAVLVHRSPGRARRREAGYETPSFLAELERVPTFGQVAYAPVSPGFGRALNRMIERFGPDVLHIHMPNVSAFWALASRRARRLPWVVHWHSDAVGPGLDTRLKLLYPAYRPLEQALLHRAAAIVATSPPYLESSPALARWRKKCSVIPLGLDEGRIRDVGGDRPGPDWTCDRALRVLAIGRLSRYKGTDVLIEAARSTRGVEAMIVGDGDADQHRRLRAAAGGPCADRIHLVGGLDDAQRNRLLHTCDVLCLPSINRAEAFGVVLLEAMAAGKPVIATRVPGSGMSWVVDDEATGWLVPPGDAAALAGLFRRLSADREPLASAGGEALARFRRRFRIESVAREFEKLYRAVTD